MRLRLKFAHKILLLGLSLIVLTAVSLTAVSAIQFRARLYEREFSSAFTVFLAGANYLTAHYKSNRERFVRSSLDFVFQNKFMRIDGAAEQPIKHLPDEVRVYDDSGKLVYAYSARSTPPADDALDPADRSGDYIKRYLRATRQMQVVGPISRDGGAPGFVMMLFPTSLESEIRTLYAQSVGVMLIVIIGASLLSLLFARRVLEPIEILTRAARRVHEGDLDQRVLIRTSDEIGLLGETFNQMISSLVRRIALMHRMQEWTVRISKHFDPAALFENLTDMFERMTHAGFVRLYVADPPGSPLNLAFFRGEPAAGAKDPIAEISYESSSIRYRLDPGGGIAAEPSQDPIELAVPLVHGGKRLGAIHLGPRADGSRYTDETLTTAATLAQHAAMAIENAQLYQAIAERERVRQEMKWAREIQQALLPRAMPEIPSFDIAGVSLPALDVGGDYFDVVPTRGEWHCMVGDVSGKGVPAALIMSIVRSFIHSYAEITETPDEILRRVNRKLTPDLEGEMFVTIAIVTLKPNERNVTLLRAGHEPALVVRSDGHVERVQAQGTALGLADAPLFDELLRPVEVGLAPGDSIVLYTDGVTEARNQQSEEVGYDRLASWLRGIRHLGAAAMVETIVKSVQAFAQGVAQADDVTVLVIKRVN